MMDSLWNLLTEELSLFLSIRDLSTGELFMIGASLVRNTSCEKVMLGKLTRIPVPALIAAMAMINLLNNSDNPICDGLDTEKVFPGLLSMTSSMYSWNSWSTNEKFSPAK